MSDPSSLLPPALPELHHLVAFAAHHLSKSTSQQPLTRHYCYTPIDKPGILDTIAALCISPQHPEPVAVSVTVDRRTRQVHLLISQTGVDHLDESRLAHIRKTWTLLHELSAQYIKIRRHPTVNGPHPGKPKELYVLYRYVYEYLGEHFLQTVREWWPKLDVVNRKFGRSMRSSPGRPTPCKRRFMDAALTLRRVVLIMGQDLSLLTSESWDRVHVLMDHAAFQASTLFRCWDLVEDWGIDFIGI